MKLAKDWGHDARRAWWYKITIDGHLFAQASQIDTEAEMRVQLERDLKAAESRVAVAAAAAEVEENKPRVLLVVAYREDLARDIGDFVARRMGLEGKLSPCPMGAFAPLPEGVRFDTVCFVGLDFDSSELRTWARSSFASVPAERCASIGCYGAAPGVDLLGAP